MPSHVVLTRQVELGEFLTKAGRTVEPVAKSTNFAGDEIYEEYISAG